MPDNLTELWQTQPVTTPPDLLKHETRRLSQRTRAEILSSVTSAGFFVLLLLWRFDAIQDRLVFLTFVPLAAWLLATIWWHRRQLWQRESAFAAPGAEFYRGELQRRRVHLRNFWLWHGPLALGCLSLGVIWLRKSVLSVERLTSVLPLLVLLAVSTTLGIRRRRREATAIQKELDELA